MLTINDYFDKVYCINLDEATERWSKCVEQFNKYGIEVERFSAIKPMVGINGLLRGEIGILRSNYSIIEKSNNDKCDKVLILEDDFVFLENFNELFDTFIKQVPEDWDFLYFGGNHLGGLIQVSENVSKMNHSYALHSFAVRKTMFDKILNTIHEEYIPVDVYYALMMKDCNAYTFRPSLSYQRNGFSYIQEKYKNYDFLMN